MSRAPEPRAPEPPAPEPRAPETQAHDTRVAAQFGPRAQAYVASPVHASGVDLDRLDDIAARRAGGRALDLGCGGGHVAYRLAPHMASVTAYDLSADMLQAVAATAAERGLANIETREGRAERLPFDDSSFDFVATRFSAHHWSDLHAGLAEARRVLRPGGWAVFIDGAGCETAAADTHLQAIELLRDTSHVRDYATAEWMGALGDVGFVVRGLTRHRLKMAFAGWVERMRTPELNRAAILALQAGASAEVRQRLGIEADGSFMLDVVMIEACPGVK